MQQNFIIQNWAIWPPLRRDTDSNLVTQEELLAGVPKMLKRRLSPLARTAFCAAKPCLEDYCSAPSVFSSSHGELSKVLFMMERLQAGEEISPTAFSLSVHNAIAGLFSMAGRNKLQSTVVAPGEEGMAPAFIEALGLLREGAEQVLLVFYDEPIPAFYPTQPYKIASEERCALALRVATRGDGLRLKMSSSDRVGDDGEQPWQLPLFIQFLAGTRASLTIQTPRHSWIWEKNVQAD